MGKEELLGDNAVFAENEEIILRTMKEGDEEIYFRICEQCSDVPQIFSNKEFQNHYRKTIKDDSEVKLMVVARETGKVCGCCTLSELDTQVPEIGIDLLESCRCKGIAYQSLNLLMQRVKERASVGEFKAVVSTGNTHMQHLLEKIGVKEVRKEGSCDLVYLLDPDL
jgi:RimJ/RimL family protein N-acetyltransferase